jgi:hypothetical protein
MFSTSGVSDGERTEKLKNYDNASPFRIWCVIGSRADRYAVYWHIEAIAPGADPETAPVRAALAGAASGGKNGANHSDHRIEGPGACTCSIAGTTNPKLPGTRRG